MRPASGLNNRQLTAGDLDNLPQPEWLVDDLLPRGSLAVVLGKPGVGKTFFALNLGLCVATGEDFAGRWIRKSKVLYIAAEGARGLAVRKNAWLELYGRQDLDGIRFLPGAVNLVDPVASRELQQLVRDEEYDLVIIDTLSRSMPGADENSPKDMTTVVEAVDGIRGSISDQRTVVVLHHPVKDTNKVRGHGSLEGAIDTTICVSKGPTAQLRITCPKQKEFPEFEEFRLELRPIGESCAIGQAAQDGNLSISRQQIVTLVQGDRTRWWNGPELHEASGLGRSTFYSQLKVLVETAIVEKEGDRSNARYRLADRSPASPIESSPI